MSGRSLEHDWFPAPLPDNVELGARSWLHSSYAFLHYRSVRRPGVIIGEDSGVYRGSFFELGPLGQVTIGKYCTLVGAILVTNGRIEIGDCTFIAHEVVIADGFTALPPEAGSAAGALAGPVTILGENVWVGTRAVILGGSRIGSDSVIGAAAVVSGEVPAGSVVAGNPARVVARIGGDRDGPKPR